jgi:hypothetical protein
MYLNSTQGEPEIHKFSLAQLVRHQQQDAVESVSALPCLKSGGFSALHTVIERVCVCFAGCGYMQLHAWGGLGCKCVGVGGGWGWGQRSMLRDEIKVGNLVCQPSPSFFYIAGS